MIFWAVYLLIGLAFGVGYFFCLPVERRRTYPQAFIFYDVFLWPAAVAAMLVGDADA